MGKNRLLIPGEIIGGPEGRGDSPSARDFGESFDLEALDRLSRVAQVGGGIAPTNILVLPVIKLVQLFILDHEGQVVGG
jgi:hypothetical protein